MRPRFPARPAGRHCGGATLISLMVGLTLSMLVIAAMMLVFRNVTRTTGEALRDAKVDDNLVASLLSAGLTLHEAGFNIDGALLDTALIVASSARLQDGRLTGTQANAASGYTGNLLVWKQNLAGEVQCSGLLAPTDGSLLRLLPSGECPDINAWSSRDWQTEVIARPTGNPPQDPSPFALTFNVTAASKICAPFAIAAPASHLKIEIKAPNSNGNELKTIECLGNFADPSATPAPTSAPASS